MRQRQPRYSRTTWYVVYQQHKYDMWFINSINTDLLNFQYFKNTVSVLACIVVWYCGKLEVNSRKNHRMQKMIEMSLSHLSWLFWLITYKHTICLQECKIRLQQCQGKAFTEMKLKWAKKPIILIYGSPWISAWLWKGIFIHSKSYLKICNIMK